MVDPVTIGAAVGWGVSAVGWLASPIVSRVLNKGFTHLDFNAPEKLKILDTQVLQLQRVMEVVDESTYRVRLEPLLNKLKSALYEAEDILDSADYESLRKKIQDAKPAGRSKKLMKNLWSATTSSPLKDKESGMPKLQLEKSLKKIENAISDACKVLEQLNLPGVSNDDQRRADATNSHSAVTTASPPLRVIGRDQDRDKIIAMLHEKEDQCQANTVSRKGYSVIGIHGIAGSGKSTIAQYVYDHEKKYKEEKMEGHFDIVMWIHVSQTFDVDSIFRDMFEGATGEACPNFNSRNVQKEKLEDKLRGKHILLVLDDVWCNIRNTRDCEELQQILPLLNVGKAGSKILVTSRTEDALVALGAVEERCIPISDLDDKVFFELFMHYALDDARIGGHDQRKLEMIGEDIAKKLKRSPLAARAVGSRLRLKPNVEFWMREKNRDLMNDTMGALWWSYQYLDEQVRRCFAYCSIFPRGHRLKRDELIQLWVAEGFIKTSKPEEEMEDVAQNYFDELLSASFLQLGGKEQLYRHEREVDYFTIHDLLCDLAEEVAGTDCFRIEKGCTGEAPLDVRYLFVGTYDSAMLTEKISGFQNLRTLIIYETIHDKSTECNDFANMFTMLTGLRKLRVLSLRVGGLGPFFIPDCIIRWKHLRYFAFRVPPLIKLTLPSAFTELYHMQVVDFGSCTELAFASGKDMADLVSLHRLVTGAVVDFPNVGRLKWLQALLLFEISKKPGYESHQLKHLNKLQDKLEIRGLENVQTREEALEVNLAGKEKLRELTLRWSNDQSCSSPEVQAEVLDGLCPSRYLERLAIANYHGKTFPSWMMGDEHNSSPKNLRKLTLVTWSQQGPAPDLGAFIHLHSLYIYGCSWDGLPHMENLTSLKELQIVECMNMQLLATLPKSLEEFTVSGCNHEFMQLCNDYWSNRKKDGARLGRCAEDGN
uniref:Uncharacterized protein n=1 Tax=Avena sativa TaxID=4498 RepID=A0ACD6A6I3_AVESA